MADTSFFLNTHKLHFLNRILMKIIQNFFIFQDIIYNEIYFRFFFYKMNVCVYYAYYCVKIK